MEGIFLRQFDEMTTPQLTRNRTTFWCICFVSLYMYSIFVFYGGQRQSLSLLILPFLLGNCRQIEFRSTYTLDGKRLKDHVISTNDVMHGDFCEMLCYREPNCVSYNLKKAAEYDGKFKCELNNSTFEGQKDKLEENSQYIYRGAKVRC